MKTMKFLNILIIGAILAVSTISTRADVFQISGGGATSLSQTATKAGVVADYGLAFGTNFEARISQGVSFQNSGTSVFTGSTGLSGHAFTRKFGIFQLYAGGGVTAEYGDTSLGWLVGPSGGVRTFLSASKGVYIYAESGYNWRISEKTVTRGNEVNYRVGLGWQF